ncbi:MAG: ferrochelatase [Burkholderiales bacterium]
MPETRSAILLINLGTPTEPTPAAVRKYLKEFLSDPYVVEIPRIVWWFILNLFILPTRSKDAAARYASIWTKEGSPLRAHTAAQSKFVSGYLGERGRRDVIVDYAMRYGEPSIKSQLSVFKEKSISRVVLLPLYPQYARSSTATALDAATAAMKELGYHADVRKVENFHDHPGYIAALANSVREFQMRTASRPDKLVMSFHGVPQYTIDRGEPYQEHCIKTGKLLAAALNLGEHQYQICFQSRFGRAEWIKPYTADVLTELGKQKTGRIDMICPGFVGDCLETLEEIAIEGKEIFHKAGGGEYNYIPCLNERHDWLNALTDIALGALDGK